MKCEKCGKKIKNLFHWDGIIDECLDCWSERLTTKEIVKHRIDFSILAIMLVIACGMLGLIVYTMSK